MDCGVSRAVTAASGVMAANTFYLTMQQSAKQQQTREASEWLAGEIANMRTKVADAEAKIENRRRLGELWKTAGGQKMY